MLRTAPVRGTGVTPDGLAAVAVSFINGCAVQAILDPDHFDIEEYLAAVEGMIGWAGWAEPEDQAARTGAGHAAAS